MSAASAGSGTTPASAEAVGRLALVVIVGLAGLLGGGAGGATGQDEITVVLSRTGFQPATLNLRKGESAHLVLKTADVEHCFAIDALRVEKRVVPGRATTLDLTPDRSGTFPFYCCLESDDAAQRGRLVVAE